MANSWLRLWHDMPTDPKWRTIARISKQEISRVISVSIHILVEASNATERGRTKPNAENIASALDLDSSDVQGIIDAMQGRFLDGDQLTGWKKRQPEKEDNSAERAKAWREKQKLLKEPRTKQNETERLRTQDKDTDKEEDKEPFLKEVANAPSKKAGLKFKQEQDSEFIDDFNLLWQLFPKTRPGSKEKAMKAFEHALKKASSDEIIDGVRRYNRCSEVIRGYAKGCAAWLNDDRWLSEYDGQGPALYEEESDDPQEIARRRRIAADEALT